MRSRPRRPKEMGTQWCNSEPEDELASGDIGDCTERLERFYFNLPRPKQLKSRGLARIHQNKVHNYVTSSLDTLMTCSQKAEAQNAILRMQAEQRLQQKLKPNLLDSKRFEAADFTETGLSLPLDTYFQKTAQSWGDDIAILEANMKTKNVGYQPRIKIIKTPLPPTSVRKRGVDWVQDVQRKLKGVQTQAMEQKISAARIEDIRAELCDFDLINRPTHFLHTENQTPSGSDKLSRPKSHHLSDPIMVGSQSAREIYNRLPTLISEEALETVKEDRHFTFSKELLQSPRNVKVGKLDRVFDVNDAIKKLKKLPESKHFDIDIDLDPKPKLTPSHDDSMFGLNCLRELVDITEGSGWENNKNENENKG